ncbi:MAG: 16S rRNA processing protein RimM [Bacteroidaceae bacterium]|nr:16S rRNA processing protein RimM [Bacteroidaceae bacterium]MBR0244247.1 16S rRNA processing protein RimM [Bacteroidaceae bacterium]
MITDHDVYKIGSLTRTHGVRGEVAFQFTDDVWDRVEADYLFLRLDGLLVPFFLEEWRFRSDNVALLKFEDIDSADDARRIVGTEVYFPKDLTPEDLDEEELEWQHFTGFEVWQDDSLLGTVTSVLDQTANVLLVVTTPDDRELLIPAHEDFVLEADHRQRRLLVSVPEELLNLNS